MKAPNFWHKRTYISYLLLPLSALYILASKIRKLVKTPTKIATPIICIGNITVGGAGKTAIAIEIGRMLKDLKVQFSYLGHGYKADIEDMILVDKDRHCKKGVGDEAILLSEISTTFISKNRVFGAKQIAKMPDEKLIIMDDGLQNPSLKKDLSILVFDGGYGCGNEMIFPAGPLRQSLKDGLEIIDFVIMIGEDRFNYSNKFGSKKVIFAKTKALDADKFKNKKLIAFCGIARPSKFFETLKEEDFHIVQEVSFGDHYEYKDKDISNLLKLADENKATLITTKKDWVRLDKEYQDKIEYLDIKIDFKDQDKKSIEDRLKKLIK